MTAVLKNIAWEAVETALVSTWLLKELFYIWKWEDRFHGIWAAWRMKILLVPNSYIFTRVAARKFKQHVFTTMKECFSCDEQLISSWDSEQMRGLASRAEREDSPISGRFVAVLQLSMQISRKEGSSAGFLCRLFGGRCIAPPRILGQGKRG